MSVICCRGPRSTLPVLTAANGIRSHERPFSTSKPNGISLQLNRNDPEVVADNVPAYPYGPARWYKQSRLGLYGGQRIQFGNNVGEKIAVKTRRSWHPNVINKNLFSKSLNRFIQIRVTTRTLRTIDKLGGLDEYLLGEKEARIKALGESGWWLRWAIMQTPTIKRRFEREKLRLAAEAGLSQEEVEGKSQVENEEVVEEAVQEEAAVIEASEIDAPENEMVENDDAIEVASKAEVQDALEHGDAVAEDGAFNVEASDKLPALKFRVGPRAHLVLTPQGWRRVRRSEEYYLKAQAKRSTEQRLQRYGPQFNQAIEKARAFLAKEASGAEEGTTWNIKSLFSRLQKLLGQPGVVDAWLSTIPKGQETITIVQLQQLQAALESNQLKRSAMVSARKSLENRMFEVKKRRAQELSEKHALRKAAAKMERDEARRQEVEAEQVAN